MAKSTGRRKSSPPISLRCAGRSWGQNPTEWERAARLKFAGRHGDMIFSHFSLRKWYNGVVVRATERPYRSGTGNSRGGDIPVAARLEAHPAIALTALRNSKHDVLGKYWTYFKERNDMFASRAPFGAPSRTCVFLSSLSRATLEYMRKGKCAPFFNVRETVSHGDRRKKGTETWQMKH